MKPELPWTSLLDLLALNKTICRGILGSVVGTQGSGPFDESGFDDFLLACGVHVRLVSGEIQPPVVIFGREFWDEKDVDTLRAQHPERHLRVYSQEMVVASMAIGGDILDHLGDEIDDFVRGHSALERFYGYMDTEVDLPASSSLSAHSQRKLLVSFDSGVWPSAGILSTMGYRVGRHGLRDGARRSILSEVMGVEIVAASPASSDYVAEWGEPASSRRLKKMTNAIAAFARNARKRSGDFSEAIEAWEADLIWLQLTYG